MTLNRRDMLFGLTAAGLTLPNSASAATNVIGGHAFGSTWRVVADTRTDPALIRSTMQTVIDQTDMEMSPYRTTSDLTRFNTSIALEHSNMPQALCDVTVKALSIAALTGGAFDPTVGPIVSRYGFGPIEGAQGTFKDITVSGDVIVKASPSLTLDLCGIAKGHALDQIIARLSDVGVTQVLVEVGGEVMTLGHHPDGRAWQVAITDPIAQDFRALHLLDLQGFALATSGHAENGVSGAVETSHIINPYYMRPAATSLASVSVLAQTALEADAFATALCAAGPTDGVALAQKLDIAALFVTDGIDAPERTMTGTFAQHILS
ncbi:thiamine biosynthesis lipoprotein [Yoonia maricola]|uniref:FAD:protein FMN transferase n=1 Tax=Yoonia maricola TaxID=420999 RepID=A0A2M8W0B5_9RHOB|nr:FAD:protein FMN transferase [Yoonia maricola]PJI84366.1 thiamine biosynthesis lipoprotein [Yoonia maricola]